MSGLIAGLSGAGGAANTTGGYYQNAMNNEINAAGSPAAADFAKLQMAQLRPEFAQQGAALSDSLAAQGITRSGSANSNFGNLASNQDATLAGVTAPLYADALNQYGAINAAMPGAQVSSYDNSIQQFLQGVGGAANLAGTLFGVPGLGGSGNGTGPLGAPTSTQDPNSPTYVPGFDTSGDDPYGS